jgi:hypothetical protein
MREGMVALANTGCHAKISPQVPPTGALLTEKYFVREMMKVGITKIFRCAYVFVLLSVPKVISINTLSRNQCIGCLA